MTAQVGRFSRVAFDPGASRSWLQGRLRRSAFRHHPPKADLGPITPQSSTVVAHHERESRMARRKLTVDRHEEIKRRLADGRSLRGDRHRLGLLTAPGAPDPRRRARHARDGGEPGSAVDVAARMAGDHPRTRPPERRRSNPGDKGMCDKAG